VHILRVEPNHTSGVQDAYYTESPLLRIRHATVYTVSRSTDPCHPYHAHALDTTVQLGYAPGTAAVVQSYLIGPRANPPFALPPHHRSGGYPLSCACACADGPKNEKRSRSPRARA
jgi:hypothetical protein